MGITALFVAWGAPDLPFVEAKIGFVHEASKISDKFLIEAMGGGVAIFDADGDGRMDLFFVNGARLRNGMKSTDLADKTDARFSNRLYRNLGNGGFADITETAGLAGRGYGQGAALGDCDNDGKPDLYVTALGGNRLYRNQGGGVFEDVTTKAGAAGGGWSSSAGFFDFDRDGLLDLFVARYLDWDFGKNKRCGGEGAALQAYCHPNEFSPVTHLVYRNVGGCRFEDVSVKSGVARSAGKGLGVAFGDVDRDGWPDVFVANDSYAQQIFRNRQDGTFEETGLAMGVAYDEDGKVFAGMGADLADWNRSGWSGVFVNALANQGYGLFKNIKGVFEHVSVATGVMAASKMHSGWGARFVDYDNDGWKDLFVAQGHVMDNIELTQPGLSYRERPMLLRNRNGKFEDAGKVFSTAIAGRGAAFGDLNNDGTMDVVVSTLGGPPTIFMNTARATNWLMIDAVGTKSNRDGIGASVRIVGASGQEQTGFVTTSGSYLSAHDKRLHFGLGGDSMISLIEIRWPSGTVQVWKNIKSNQVFTAREKEQ